MTRRIMIALVSFVLLLVSAGCGGSTSNGGQVSPAPGTTAPTTPGTSAPTAPDTTAPGGATVSVETVYKQNCLACHGTNLEGSMGPKLSDVGARLSEEQIAGILKEGRGNMPAFQSKLSEDEIAGLSTWLAAKK